MIVNSIYFLYLSRVYMILIVYQQNLQQITLIKLIDHKKIKNKIRTFEPEIG